MSAPQLNVIYLKPDNTKKKKKNPFPITKHLLLGKNKLNYFEAYNLIVVEQKSKVERFIFTIEVH